MRKNILIMGIGRAGKTTLSKMIKNKFTSYNLIHSDSLKWALIRANDQERFYRQNVEKQKEFENNIYFQKTLLEFFNSLTQDDHNQYGYILESGQLTPKLVKEMVDFDNTIVVCLGLGNLSVEGIVDQCIQYDTEDSWTYGLPKAYIAKHAKDWYTRNEILKVACPKYHIPYFDTSYHREDVLTQILDTISTEI